MKHGPVWIAVSIIVLGLSLVWLTFSDSRAPDESGTIQVIQNSSSIPAPEIATSGSPDPIAVPAAEITDPMDLYALVRSEQRDASWADTSEAAINNSLREVPYVGRGLPLEVRCASTICEVTGVASPGSSLDMVQLAWKALEQSTRSKALTERGLTSVAPAFGTGRSEYAFVLYYRRGALS